MAILLSHGHADHCAGASMLADMLGAPILGHESFTTRMRSSGASSRTTLSTAEFDSECVSVRFWPLVHNS
ncbi:MBL fold metallo-hydrolase [Paracoccus mutanolyticus]